MIELIDKYKNFEDLGTIVPESLLLIDKYKHLFKLIDTYKTLQYDKYK